MHGSIATHRKQQTSAFHNRTTNARLHLDGARRQNKFRRHLAAFKRVANPSQISLGPPRTGNRIHEHNAFIFAEKFGKVFHAFVMLTNTAATVNFKRA